MKKYIPYIGLTYKPSARGDTVVDCWGLIVVLYRELFSIELPTFTECSVAKTGSDGMVDFLFATDLYKQCTKIELDQAKEGDLLLLTNAGQPTHIAMVIDDEHMIHCFDRAGSVIESYRSRKWKPRIQALYRHPHFN